MIKLHSKHDVAHGWLQVPMKLIRRLNIADKISVFSYKAGGYAFLEEDCDWTIFHRAMEANGLTYSVEPEIVDGESIVRSYDSFTSN
jgi:hypothetical protein